VLPFLESRLAVLAAARGFGRRRSSASTSDRFVPLALPADPRSRKRGAVNYHRPPLQPQVQVRVVE